ncbi:hypothetical protein BCR43DRAFT_490702 [Syncephalastrum racemosum]|uniref:PAS domain-containing protein n=1 Tax=Syncephalastrum racemosum TaxID=13706 RepID=A0A1X2HGF2_SYNRA|nr:hypothetical protein BCR43DRAFT_490702 [Syncephalastrum racemosum]
MTSQYHHYHDHQHKHQSQHIPQQYHPHSFHDCPLRSSSLLIIDRTKQTIITATDEVFNTLGYSPVQLIGHNVGLLDLRPLQPRYVNTDYNSNSDNGNGGHYKRYMARHESTGGQVALEICVHPDAMASCADLDYWLLRPLQDAPPHGLFSPTLALPQIPALETTTDMSPMTVLRLSPYGMIEHAQSIGAGSLGFGTDLTGQPIMSFVHPSDVQSLCEGLSQTYKLLHHTFHVRWQRYPHHLPTQTQTQAQAQQRRHHSIHKNANKDIAHIEYEWATLTVMTMPRRLSCTAASDPLSRPICILRPYHPARNPAPPCRLLSSFLRRAHVTLDYYRTQGQQLLFGCLTAIHTAFGQGKLYMVEYLAHVLITLVDLMADILGPAATAATPPATGFPTSSNVHRKLKRNASVCVARDDETFEIIRLRQPAPSDFDCIQERQHKWLSAIRMLRMQTESSLQWPLALLSSAGLSSTTHITHAVFDTLEKSIVTGMNRLVVLPINSSFNHSQPRGEPCLQCPSSPSFSPSCSSSSFPENHCFN